MVPWAKVKTWRRLRGTEDQSRPEITHGGRAEDASRGHPKRSVVAPRRPTIDVCFVSKEGARITGARTHEDVLRKYEDVQGRTEDVLRT